MVVANPTVSFQFPVDDPVVSGLLNALASSQAGICLCDDRDIVRYVNETFRVAFMPTWTNPDTPFIDALAGAIRAGRGIRLQSVSLEEFCTNIRQRRAAAGERRNFTVDLVDGSWWYVNDIKLPNSWFLSIVSEVTAMKSEELALRQAHASALKAAQTDFLTGLPNRRHGLERAAVAVQTCQSEQRPVTMALLDVDHFKQVNDRHGHEVGDRVLKHFAHLLASHLTPHGQVSRVGGEEFLVVMPAMDLSTARSDLMGVFKSLASERLDLEGCDLRYSFSGGLATVLDGESLNATIRRADTALYAAKSNGRSRLEVSIHGRDAAGAEASGFRSH